MSEFIRDEAFEESYSQICKPIIARPYPRNENGEYIYKEIHEAYLLWKEAKAIPAGYRLTKIATCIGNAKVDWSKAPEWAKYWLMDGHSKKFWWSSIRPTKDLDLDAYVWKSGYLAKEAPSFDYSGTWDKSITSRKSMELAQ